MNILHKIGKAIGIIFAFMIGIIFAFMAVYFIYDLFYAYVITAVLLGVAYLFMSSNHGE